MEDVVSAAVYVGVFPLSGTTSIHHFLFALAIGEGGEGDINLSPQFNNHQRLVSLPPCLVVACCRGVLV